jgi:hypothetical protein
VISGDNPNDSFSDSARLAVIHRGDDLGELGAHAEEPREPQPPQCARAADHDRRRNAGDVANADGGRQRRRHGLERRDGAAALALLEHLAQHFAECEPEPADLDESGENGEQQARSHQQDDHRPAPDEAVQRTFE